MTISLSSPVTGATQTGLSSPTYTLTSDLASESNARQWAVTALGGTQTGVDAHSVARPFTVTAGKPKTIRYLGKPNPVTGVINSVPLNRYFVITRKGVTPLAGQPSANMVIRTTVDVVAGSDLADPANVRAALSLHIGSLNQVSSGIGDTCVTNIL